MLSRVAAVKAPRTHNRRRVTGSHGRRREGRESEPRRPNMSRRVFTSAVLLLFVVMICCGISGATPANEEEVKNDLINIQNLERVDLFVPLKTLVLLKGERGSGTLRDLFASPSLVSAGGVIAAFAEGHINAKYQSAQLGKTVSSDVVAEYIDSAWDWPTLVAKVKEEGWSAHTVLGTTDGNARVSVVFRPTTTMKDNKVFLLVGSFDVFYESGGNWKEGSPEVKLVVGEVTNPARGEPGGWIKWGDPKPLSKLISSASHKGEWREFIASGGSGVLMEDGAIVFSLMAESGNGDRHSLIIYSTDNGSTWSLSEGVSPANCTDPRITEWEGSLLMIVDCKDGQRVYESRDMGTTWTEAIGKLSGVWAKPRSVFWDVSLHVGALITATIGGREVMLYTQRGYASGEKRATALYLWVTDSNRSFSVGPVAVEDNMNWKLASSLLYSDGSLHLLQQRESAEHSAISLSRLTEELKEIESVLSTWAQKDVFFSGLSIPTAGLVAVFSNALSGGDTWIDEYLCLNATVTNATKVKDGFQLTEPDSRVMWPVNTRDNNVRHVFLSHDFTLVASVTIEEAPSWNTPLLTAVLVDTWIPYIMRLSYTADNKWETIFKYEKITKSGTWVPKKEHQVALMLQGNKVSVYIDGESLGEEEALSTDEKPPDVLRFCFGACDFDDGGEEKPSPKETGKKPRVTVTNVFMYNRPLNSTEMSAIKDRKPVPKREPESRVREALEGAAAREHATVVGLTCAGSGLLPLLLLLVLWGFAAA
ncbi:putative trans-sialidase, Group II [Trypanosoma cruzi]|uniref:Putative trans-sialidase, Group II n=1 Tax=Trypanosoma cruzi TaxID=5693 RepID=A0A2V2UHR3_TRYCR|nr:putative trans-sialidase, Group II [Trypanosoma cruzi]